MLLPVDCESPLCAEGQQRWGNGRELDHISVSRQGAGLRAMQLPRSSAWWTPVEQRAP